MEYADHVGREENSKNIKKSQLERQKKGKNILEMTAKAALVSLKKLQWRKRKR